MLGAAIGKAQVDSSPVFVQGNYLKRCGPAINLYGLRNARNRLGLLNCAEKWALVGRADPQRTIAIIGILFQEKYSIQTLPLLVSLVRNFSGCQLNYFCNDAMVQAIPGRVR